MGKPCLEHIPALAKASKNVFSKLRGRQLCIVSRSVFRRAFLLGKGIMGIFISNVEGYRNENRKGDRTMEVASPEELVELSRS